MLLDLVPPAAVGRSILLIAAGAVALAVLIGMFVRWILANRRGG